MSKERKESMKEFRHQMRSACLFVSETSFQWYNFMIRLVNLIYQRLVCNGRNDGWTGGRTGEWVDGRTGGRTNLLTVIQERI